MVSGIPTIVVCSSRLWTAKPNWLANLDGNWALMLAKLQQLNAPTLDEWYKAALP
jgi:hypothetical protein